MILSSRKKSSEGRTLRQAGFAGLILLLPVVFLVFGAVLGYWYAGKAGKTGSGSIAQNIVQTRDTKKLSQRLIDDVAKAWGPLVTAAYGEFRVRGTVVSTEIANTSPNGPGWYITLKKDNVQNKFFVSRDTDWYQGNFAEYGKWTKPRPEDIKPGDDLTIHTHGELNDTTTQDTFFGFWVFKHIQ